MRIMKGVTHTQPHALSLYSASRRVWKTKKVHTKDGRM